MKSLKNRIGIHFLFQFILIFISTFVFLGFLLFILVNYLVKEEMKANIHTGTMETILAETYYEEDKPKLDSHWKSVLIENGMWLQILNKKGEVVYSINEKTDIPKAYTSVQLLNLHETRELGNYKVQIGMDEYNLDFIYVLGHENLEERQIQQWIETYNIMLNSSSSMKLEKLEAEVSKYGYLQIIDTKGDVIHTIGSKAVKKHYLPVELLKRKFFPGDNQTLASMVLEPTSQTTWVLYTKNEKVVDGSSLIKKIIIALSIAGSILLAFTIIITVWHAFRYGQPLLLFISWLELLGKGNYQTYMTVKDKKKIYTRKGRLRSQYKLYREVIQSFEEMALRLENIRKDREQLERTREEWMTGISHDLRTPLATIQGYGHLLESGHYTWTDDELTDIGKTIREKGTYMLSLVEDFSLAFQIKNNQIPLTLEKVNLNKHLQHQVLSYVNNPTNDHVQFQFEITSDADIFVTVDKRMITRVFDNLLHNAVKHNPKDTKIIVTLDKQGNNAVITITDNGNGMDEETRKRLFDRYYRGTNTDESTEGAGLGMSIAKAIIDSHNGSITVTSEVGIGTKLQLVFPL